MPARPGLAARRFYRTFYDWTLLTIDAGGRSKRHALHTSSRASIEGNGNGASRPRHQHQPSGLEAATSRGNGTTRDVNVESKRVDVAERRRGYRLFNPHSSSDSAVRPATPDKYLRHNVPGSFTKRPVQSPLEKAFSSFEAREHVVRYRSPDAILLEFAMPGEGLALAQSRWGPGLESLHQRTGARVEVQAISVPIKGSSGARIHSVLISGTLAQAAVVLEILLYRSALASRSQEAAPSASMSPWQLLIRAHEGSQVVAEMSMLEEHWVSIAHLKAWARAAMDSGLALELGPPESRPSKDSSNQLAPARSFHFKGPLKSVQRFRTELQAAVKSVKNHVPPKNSLSSAAGNRELKQPSPPAIPGTINDMPGAEVAAVVKDTVQNTLAVNNSATPTSRNLDATQSSETPMRGVITIDGKDVLQPAVRDAVWCDIAQPPSGVIICRQSTPSPGVCCWRVEIVGPSAAVTTARVQIMAAVDNLCRRLQLKKFTVTYDESLKYRYLLTITGKDAVRIRSVSKNGVSWRSSLPHEIRRRGVRVIRSSPDIEPWQIRFEVEPQFFNQVAEGMEGIIGEVGVKSGARDYKTSWTLDTLDEVLPASGRAPVLLERSGPANQASNSASTARETAVDGHRAATPRDAAAEATVPKNLTDPHSQRSGTAAIANPDEHVHGQGKEVQSQRPGITLEEQRQIAENVRVALRSLTHPVVLITTRTSAREGRSLLPHKCARGVTVSSFNTVTLDPQPVVSFNLKIPSRSWDAMCQSNKLCVHLLEASSRGAAVADTFTKPHDRPEMGFEELRKLGLKVYADNWRKVPMILDPRGGVIARFEAVLLPAKCVTVGDHVVVLAEITKVASEIEEAEECDGLAYARRGYRAPGKELIPAEILSTDEAAANDPLSLGADEPSDQSYVPLVNLIDEVETSDPHAFFALGDDPIFNALRATKDAAESGKDVDIYAAMAMEDDGFDDDTLPEQGRSASVRPSSRNHARKRSGQPEHHTVRRLVRAGDGSLTPNGTPNGGISPGKRAFSILTKYPALIRGFSSTSTAQRGVDDDHDLVDPTAKTTTVADYLGVPDDNKPYHTRRVRRLVRFQKEIRDAEQRLEREHLSEAEATALKETIAYQERTIARKLAWNAAIDLRVMLDKGNARVEFKRAQWLESAVEKGLNVLLEDAKSLRRKREEGKVNAEQYEFLKQKLAGDHAVLQTELMRLREVADEDQDGGD